VSGWFLYSLVSLLNIIRYLVSKKKKRAKALAPYAHGPLTAKNNRRSMIYVAISIFYWHASLLTVA
jgi:hypothetical protein